MSDGSCPADELLAATLAAASDVGAHAGDAGPAAEPGGAAAAVALHVAACEACQARQRALVHSATAHGSTIQMGREVGRAVGREVGREVALDATLPSDSLGAGSHRVGPRAAAETPAARAAAAANGLPRKLGRYTLRSVLGEGTFGTVFQASDDTLGREVAVKVLRRERLADDDLVRFGREMQALAKLRHPNVVTVFDGGSLDGSPYLVMELVQGGSLRGQLAKPLSKRSRVQLALGIGKGVAAVHQAGFVHRDIKPDNVLLDDQQRAVLGDFGLARQFSEPSAPVAPRSAPHVAPLASDDLTQEGAIVGTLAYMAPEQMVGEPATPASDQFALAATMWEVIHGARPFRDHNRYSAIERGEFVSKRTVSVDRILQRALAFEPAKRWPSVAVLVSQLERKLATRRRVASAATVAVAATAVGAAVWLAKPTKAVAPACPWDDDIVAQWRADSPSAVRAAFAKTAVAGAPQLADAVIVEFDRFANGWQQVATQVCAAPVELREQGRACLTTLLATFASLKQRFQNADDVAVASSAILLDSLVDPSMCASTDTQALALTRDPALFARLQQWTMQYRLASSEAELPPESEMLAILRTALDTNQFTVAALAEEYMGTMLSRSGDQLGAVAAYQRMATYADRGSADVTRVKAYLAVGRELLVANLLDEADVWLRMAEAAAERSGSNTTHLAELYSIQGMAAARRDNAQASATLLKKADELCQTVDCTNLLRLQIMADRAAAETKLERFADALASYERLLAMPVVTGVERGLLAANAAQVARVAEREPRAKELALIAKDLVPAEIPNVVARAEQVLCQLAVKNEPWSHAQALCNAALGNANVDDESRLEIALAIATACSKAGQVAYAQNALSKATGRSPPAAAKGAWVDAMLALAKLQPASARAATLRLVGPSVSELGNSEQASELKALQAE